MKTSKLELQKGKLLTPLEVADILGLKSVHTLAVWRCSKRYPLPFAKVGGLVRYLSDDISEFINNRIVNGECE